MWQREGDYRTFTCGREKETTELLHVTERRRLQNFYMWQSEGDYRTFICGREKETTELLGLGGGRRFWGGCPIFFADLRGTAPAPLVPASLPHPRHPYLRPHPTHSASRPRPQRSTGDVRSLAGCHPKETLHCCRVTSVVFRSACSVSTYAGHHLLCPLQVDNVS